MGKLMEMKNISKAFPGVKALDHVSLSLEKGEVLGMLGENGAGKSTLMKVLSGVYTPDEGEIYIEGQKVELTGPKQALDLGIAIIYQELNLYPTLTVAENIFLTRLPKSKFGKINYQKLFQNTKEILDSYGFELNPRAIVGELPVGAQQMTEIAKAVCSNAKVILMDEPTSALSETESEKLFQVVETLRDRGVAIVFISHKMEEIFRLCSKVKVLRDGQDMGESDVSNATEEELIRLMVGREIGSRFPKKTNTPGEVYLQVQHLHDKDFLKDISFEVRRGEVFGLAGLVGSGRTELVRAIFGADPNVEGTVLIGGKQVKINNPRNAIDNGIALIPEDRRRQGLVLTFDILQNVSLASMKKIRGKLAKINSKREKEMAEFSMKQMSVKASSCNQNIATLSGGNQQKVILGKWMHTDFDIIIFDDPTRGIDVGTKAEIYSLINQLTNEGKAVILISSELPEVISMSDRIGVMYQGQMTAILEKEDLNQETIMKYAIGV